VNPLYAAFFVVGEQCRYLDKARISYVQLIDLFSSKKTQTLKIPETATAQENISIARC